MTVMMIIITTITESCNIFAIASNKRNTETASCNIFAIAKKQKEF
jgi:hypothetical protein